MMPRLNWMDEAACYGEDLDLFFLPRNQRDTDTALAICASCPVQLDCRDHALDAEITYGIWGGLTEDDRAELHRQNQAAAT